MNPSLLIDIEKQLGQEQANNFISEMSRDPFEGIKNNVKSMFSHLRDEDITEILRKYNNNAEAAFEELMDRNNQIEENKKRERKLEEERKRMELNNRYVETMVRNFQMLDKKEIEEVFRKNNNDAQLTTNELYKMMKEREQKNEEAQKMKKQMEIQNMVSGFSEKFGEISKEELIRVIVSNDLNVEKITFELGKMQNQKIFDELFMQHYTVLSSEEIRQVCEESNWNKIEALKVLQGKRIEIELKKQIEVLKQNDVAIPKLEYSGQQLENLKQESHSKMIDVKKIIEIEEVKNEEETKKNIEKMIIENSQPEENAIKENLPASNECTIAVEIQESKIVATVDFKSMTNYSWIGFYAKEESNDKYKVYNYLCKLSDNKFSVDKPLINGSYNFRVFHQSYINVQTSEEIVLQKDDFVKMVRDEKNDKVINVSWQIGSVDPYAVSAYVTVHKKEEERANYYRRWNWIKTFNGTHTFKTPIHTGEYEARVYYNGKVQFRSETMKIEGI